MVKLMVLSCLSPFFAVLRAVFKGNREEIKQILKGGYDLNFTITRYSHDYTLRATFTRLPLRLQDIKNYIVNISISVDFW